MVSPAQDVASTRELTDLIGSKLQVVRLSRQVLHLDHECWNPETVHHIVGI